MIISRRILLGTRNFPQKKLYRKSKHILCSTIYFFQNRVAYEIMQKNIVKPDRPQMTIYVIWRMRFACWITKAIDTLSEYITIIAFPRQQQLRDCASMLHNTYIACLVLVRFAISSIQALPNLHNFNLRNFKKVKKRN